MDLAEYSEPQLYICVIDVAFSGAKHDKVHVSAYSEEDAESKAEADGHLVYYSYCVGPLKKHRANHEGATCVWIGTI